MGKGSTSAICQPKAANEQEAQSVFGNPGMRDTVVNQPLEPSMQVPQLV